jgi:hypothetical protein
MIGIIIIVIIIILLLIYMFSGSSAATAAPVASAAPPTYTQNKSNVNEWDTASFNCPNSGSIPGIFDGYCILTDKQTAFNVCSNFPECMSVWERASVGSWPYSGVTQGQLFYELSSGTSSNPSTYSANQYLKSS